MIRHAVPGVVRVQHGDIRRAGAQLRVHDRRNEILALERVARQVLVQKRRKPARKLAQVQRRKAPEVHGHRRIARQVDEVLTVLGVGGVRAALLDVRALRDALEHAIALRADAARHAAVCRDGVAQAEAHHGIRPLGARHGEKIIQQAVGLDAVIIIGIDNGERPVNLGRSAQHGMGRAPRLRAARRHGIARRQRVELLIGIAHVERRGHGRADAFTKLLGRVLLDDEHDLAEARAVSVKERIVQQKMAVLVHGRRLLRPSKAAAHAGGHDDQTGLIHRFSLHISKRVCAIIGRGSQFVNLPRGHLGFPRRIWYTACYLDSLDGRRSSCPRRSARCGWH